MSMRANRDIAVPIVIIILLTGTGIAGWTLYSKNQKIIDEIADNKAKLLEQIKSNVELETIIYALRTSRVEAGRQIDTLNGKIQVLQDEIADKGQLQIALKQANKDRRALTARYDQATRQAETLTQRVEALTQQATRLQRQAAEEREQTQRQIAALTQTREELRQTLAQRTDERDEARQANRRSRRQLAELMAQMESNQQNSKSYQVRLDLARQELTTTSEQADSLAQRLLALQAERKRERLAFNELRDKLNAELGKNSVAIEQNQNRYTLIRLQGDVLFNSGSAQLLESARVVLRSIGNVLKQYPDRHIQIEGHTDNLPLAKNSNYPSNWELSSARASSAVRFLIDNSAISPQRLRATGRGEYNSITDNSTSQARTHNRRIEIKLLPVGLTEVAADSVGN